MFARGQQQAIQWRSQVNVLTSIGGTMPTGWTPFQQLRFWARRAPASQRVGAVVGGVLVTVAVLMLMLPVTSDANSAGEAIPAAPGAATGSTEGDPAATSGDGVASTPGADIAPEFSVPGQPSPGARANPGDRGTGNTAGSGRPAETSAGGAGSQQGSGCVSPPGTDQGVTEREIRLAFLIPHVPGATEDETSRVRGSFSAADFEATYAALVKHFNEKQPIACRKLVADYIRVNPLVESELQATCRDVEQKKPFAVFPTGAYILYAHLAACYPRAGIPYINPSIISLKQEREGWPYMLSSKGITEVNLRNTAHALHELGWFSAATGFKKLGLLYRSCEPQVVGNYKTYLAEVGIKVEDEYNFGCGTAGDDANAQQAVLQFQRAGVTHVTTVGMGTADIFARRAKDQGYAPKYGFPGDTAIGAAAVGEVDRSYLVGAIYIDQSRYFDDTINAPLSPGSQRCQDILVAAGRPPLYRQPSGYGGWICNGLFQLELAINNAPVLQRNALATGLRKAGTFDFSYPLGPADFSYDVFGPTASGGQNWRILDFKGDCACWTPRSLGHSRAFR